MIPASQQKPTDDELRRQATQLFRPSTENVMVDMARQTTEPDPLAAPAVTLKDTVMKDVNLPVIDTGLDFAGTKVENILDVDPRGIMPNVSVSEVYKLDKPVPRQIFMQHQQAVNKQGDVMTIPAPLDNLSEQENLKRRIDILDRFGATGFINQGDDGEEIYDKIPFGNLLTQLFKFPEGEVTPFINPETGNRIPVDELTLKDAQRIANGNNIFSYNFAGKGYAKPLFARQISEMLVSRGVTDERTRTIIIRDQINSPAMGDFTRIARNLGDTGRMLALEMPTFFIGESLNIFAEVADAVYEDFNQAGLVDFAGEGDPEFEQYLPFTDFKARQNFMDKVLLDSATKLQMRMAQIGADITYSDAYELAHNYTGMLPRGVKLYGEIKSGTGLVRAGAVLKSAKEKALFDKFLSAKRRDGDKRDFNVILDDYLETQTGRLEVSSPALFPLSPVTVVTKKGAERRITQAFQIDDAALPAAERAEVVQARNALKSSVERKASLEKQIAAGDVPSRGQAKTLEFLNQNIADLTIQMKAIELRSSTPKFVRDMNFQDKYLVAGATAFGHYYQETNSKIDSQLGELIGMIGGMTVAVARGSVANGAKFNDALTFLTGKPRGDLLKQLNEYYRMMSGTTPEFRAVAEARANLIAQYQDELIGMGLDPSSVNVTLSQVSDLAALRLWEEQAIATMKVADTRKGPKVEDLEQVAKAQERLLADLRGTLMGQANLNAQGELFELIKGTVTEGTAHLRQLRANIDRMQNEGVEHFFSIAESRLAQFDSADTNLPAKESGVTDFPQLMDSLIQNKLYLRRGEPGYVDESVFTEDIANLSIKVSKVAENAARQATYKLGDVESAQAAVAASAKPTLTVREGKPDAIERPIADFDTPGQVLAFFLESHHAIDKGKASRLFTILDNDSNVIQFRTPQGDTLSGTPKANIGDLLSGLLVRETETGPVSLLRKQKRDLSAAERKVLIDTVTDITDPIISTLAQSQNKKHAEILDGLYKQVEKAGYVFKTTGKEKQVELFRYINDGGTNVLTMNFTQLRNLRSALSEAQFNASKQPVAAAYETAVKRADELFENGFSLKGVPAGQLTMEIDNAVVPVTDVIKRANADWFNYKDIWVDRKQNATVANWLFSTRKPTQNLDGSRPTGIAYSKAPDEWLDMESVLNMSTEALTNMRDNITRAIGTDVMVNNTFQRQLVAGEPKTVAFRHIVEAHIARYLENNKRTIQPQQLQDNLNKFQEVFQVKDPNMATGTRSLIDTASIIDEVYGYGPRTVGQEVATKASAEARSRISQAISSNLEPARRREQELNTMVTSIARLAQQDADAIPSWLVGGGIQRLKDVKNTLKLEGNYSDEKIQDILSDVYFRGLVQQSFLPTGRRVVNKDGKQVELPAYDSNKMAEYLGVDNPEKAAAVRQLLGDKKYNNARAIHGFMAEMNKSPFATRVIMNGIPRGMSPESWISRFYAVNRDVVSPRYVGTEALFQSMRFSRFNFLRQLYTDPELGQVFLEMVRVGKPLSPQRNAQFEKLLLRGIGQQNSLFENQKVTDDAGREISMDIIYSPAFPEMQEAQKQDIEPSIPSIFN